MGLLHGRQVPFPGPPEGDPLELWPQVSHPCLVKDLPGTVRPAYPPRLDGLVQGTVAD